MKRVRNFTAALAAAMVASQMAAAGPVGEAADRAEDLLTKGETMSAYAAFNTAQHAFWQMSPLAFRKAVLVDRAGGFGDYETRAGADFSVGDTLTVYAEPVGFGIGRQSGRFEIGLNTDFAIETANGQVLTRSDDLFSVRHQSRSQNRDFNMTLSLVLPLLKPGAYVAVFSVKDQNSGKTGEFRIGFNIVS